MDSAARRQLCVRICGHTRDSADCRKGAPDEGGAAAETADRALSGAPEGSAAAAGKGDPDLMHHCVMERTAGLPVDAPSGVEVVTDMWAYKRRQALLASPK